MKSQNMIGYETDLTAFHLHVHKNPKYRINELNICYTMRYKAFRPNNYCNLHHIHFYQHAVLIYFYVVDVLRYTGKTTEKYLVAANLI